MPLEKRLAQVNIAKIGALATAFDATAKVACTSPEEDLLASAMVFAKNCVEHGRHPTHALKSVIAVVRASMGDDEFMRLLEALMAKEVNQEPLVFEGTDGTQN